MRGDAPRATHAQAQIVVRDEPKPDEVAADDVDELLIHVPTQIGDAIDVRRLLVGLNAEGANVAKITAVVAGHYDPNVSERVAGFYRRLGAETIVTDRVGGTREAMVRILDELLERLPRRAFMIFGAGYGIGSVEDLIEAGVGVALIAKTSSVHGVYSTMQGVDIISPATRGWQHVDRRVRAGYEGGEALG